MSISHWLSRYHPRYVRSLVYMLQQSEYDVGAYLKWYHRTKDFVRVERRKHLVETHKALILLGIGWIMLLTLYGVAFALLMLRHGSLAFPAVAVAVLVLAPFLLAYLLIIPLGAIQFVIQRPAEYFLLRQTQRRLAGHRAVKIAIAGSFGKTTMREILKTVLAEGKKVATPPESYNTPLGIRAFAKTLKGDEDVLVFELGEYYPGDIKKLCELVRPAMGVITGVNEAHLERFKSLDQTAATIYELADYLGGKPVYVNGENELARANIRSGHILYSRERVGSNVIEYQKTDLTGTSFTMLLKNGQKIELHSDILGLHQIGPLGASLDIALRLGLSPDQVKRGIAKTKPFSHRLELKTDSAGVIMLDDSYNGNPDGVRAVIEFLASLKNHRRWYVTPGLVEMGTRTEAVHKEIGRMLARAYIEKVVLIKNSVTSFIDEGLREEGYEGDVLWFDDALAAFAALPHLTAAGDAVLLQNDWPDQYS